jgi:outer membrane protein
MTMHRLLFRGSAALLLLGAAAPVRAQDASATGAPSRDTLRLTVRDAVTRAIRISDEARVAAARVDVADAQVTVARSAALPQLRLNGNYTRTFETARGQAVGQIFNQPNSYTVNANVTQPVFQGGRAIAGARAAGRLRGAARFTQRETRDILALDAQRAYLDALLAERLLDIQVTNLALADERLRQTEALERGGRAARYDVLRARVERANLEPLVIQARSDRELARLELVRLLDLPTDRPIVLAERLDATTLLAMADTMAVDSGVPVDRRQTVRAAELTAEARRDAVWAARADWLPTVSVFFNTGFGAFPTTNRFPRGGGVTTIEEVPCRFVTVDGSACTAAAQNGGWFGDRSMGVQVSWPLFDGLRTKGNVDLAQAQAREADAVLSQQRELANVAAASARAELARARATFSASRQTVTEAEEAFQLASLRFSRGLGTRLDVSDAQLALLTARTGEARAANDLYLATAELAHALGRDVPLPPTVPADVTTSPAGPNER